MSHVTFYNVRKRGTFGMRMYPFCFMYQAVKLRKSLHYHLLSIDDVDTATRLAQALATDVIDTGTVDV